MRTRHAPPPHQPEQTPGDQPGAATGRELTADAAAVEAMQRRGDARMAAGISYAGGEPDPIPAAAPPVLVRSIREANEEWHPESFTIEPGTFVQLVGRDPWRDGVDIANQSSVFGGAAVVVALCLTQRDAQELARDAAHFRAPGRHCYLPDGTGRTMGHGVAVWAVADPSAAVAAIVDVSPERGRRQMAPR